MKDFVEGHTGSAGLNQAVEEALAHQRDRVRHAFGEFSRGIQGRVLDLGAIGRSQPADRLSMQGVQHRVIFHDVLLPSDRQLSAAERGTASVLELPFADEEFDWVFCNRVLECAGDKVQQYMLLKELVRISRRGLFVTAANKRHPLEFNTGIPLLHWLPERQWKRCLAWLGKQPTPSGLPLNLLDASDLSKLAGLLSEPGRFDIGHIRYLGIKACFFLMITK